MPALANYSPFIPSDYGSLIQQITLKTSGGQYLVNAIECDRLTKATWPYCIDCNNNLDETGYMCSSLRNGTIPTLINDSYIDTIANLANVIVSPVSSN